MKTKLIVLIAIAIVSYLGINSQAAVAQHSHTGDCNKRIYDESLRTIAELTEVAQQAVANNNFDQALEIMGHIRRQSATAMAFCMSLAYQSEAVGLQASIGPVAFPNGAYIARIITNGTANVTISPVSGECGGGAPLFVAGDRTAMAPNGMETGFSSYECLAMIEVSGATQPWILQFEPSGTSGAVGVHVH